MCLLGKEPGEGQTAAYEPPDTCPCCGRKVSGSICPECGYQLPNHPPRGPQYAVVATRPGFVQSTESSAQLVKYCGFTQEDANNAIAHYVNNQSASCCGGDWLTVRPSTLPPIWTRISSARRS